MKFRYLKASFVWVAVIVFAHAALNTAFAETFTVFMLGNNKFSPATLTINVGDTVSWTDVQGQHDTVSGVNGVPNGIWNSGSQYPRLMSPGQTFSFTFTRAGTYPYYCTPHWQFFGMVGSIQVNAANVPPSVSILSPANGADFSAPADVTIQADASDSDGRVTQVEFFMNGSSIGVVTAAPYSVTANNLGAGAYTFSATATDDAGATSSASVSVTVSGQQPVITSPPQSQTVNAGSDVLFTVQATGSQPLSYQWSFGQTAIPGANGTSLLLTNVSSAQSGIYTVQVSNPFGSASASATLSVTNPPSGTPPEITTQPQSQTVKAGTNVTFTAAAIGSEPLSWQWFFNNVALPGETNSSLVILNASENNAGSYYVVVNNPFGSSTSTTATLTVVVAPVCNPTLSKSSASFEAGGGSDSVAVITGADCSWTATNTNAWILITSGRSGVGPGSVNFTVLSNATRNARSGVLQIAGNTFTVNQAGAIFIVTSDFNRDGYSDFLWQNVDGRVRLWLMNGTSRIANMLLRNGRPATRGARIVGTHDFDGDHNEDILWQHANGRLEIWFMNRTNFVRGEFISPAPALGNTWNVVGLGDFNHDTHSDILLRHTDGYLRLWFMKGKRFVKELLLNNGDPVPSQWRVAGVADMNHDGSADVIWQGPDNSLVVWFMTDTLPATGPLLSNLPRLNARLVGLNDLDTNGSLDLIWRYPDGHLSAWSMTGTNRMGTLPITPAEPVPSAWKFAAPRN